MIRRRPAFTLIEVVIAIVLFSIGAIALVGSAAAMTRQMAVSGRRSRAATIARSRAEDSHSRPCSALSGGSEQLQGIRSEWEIIAGANAAEVAQRVEYGSALGDHAERYRTATSCE